MSMHVHELRGCTPTPLAGYLKALGVLRLVGEQKDPAARGLWREGCFVLISHLDRSSLCDFFLTEYSPTPLLTPWARGGGFYKDPDEALAAIETSAATRFSAYRAAISAARVPLQSMLDCDAKVRSIKQRRTRATPSEKRRLDNDPAYKAELDAAERDFKQKKVQFLPMCRKLWRGEAQHWMDAALVLQADGEAKYPALLGTGGMDGRLDFTYNAMRRLKSLFDLTAPEAPATPAASAWLGQCLFGDVAAGLQRAAVGQYHPSAAGGANASTGSQGEALSNPWDFLLMLEGAVSFQSAASRRWNSMADRSGAAPFATRSNAAGGGTTSQEEESVRGEQWMPLWGRPSTHREVQLLLAEGRAQVGSAGAQQPIDFARAVARLGISRGVTSFVRYGYLQRNGLSNLAIPLGSIEVAARPTVRLLDDIERWLHSHHRLASEKHAPARQREAERNLGDAAFAAATRPELPSTWQSLLLAMTEVEKVQATGTGTKAGPIPKLRPDWLAAADDGSTEFRLACALASASADYTKGKPPQLGPIRHHFLPLQRIGKYDARFAADTSGRLRHDVRVVAHGRDAVSDLVAIAERRLLESTNIGRRVRLTSPLRFCAQLADLARFVAGELDLDLLLGLARALMAVEWDRTGSAYQIPGGNRTTLRADLPPPGWRAIRLTMLPFDLETGVSIPTEPTTLRRLAAGDAALAYATARRRLLAHGVTPGLSVTLATPAAARLWAASMLFPISQRDAVRLARSLTPASASK
ncbi:MAG: type I-U CRISPR-associated protein Csx17 [Planctomycetes bacterium]|nr:type I-U CRISPR-associated protein Csx17 [Planctomycetota bacterium]MCC7065157.1 type I-U CRISPR-associated protein Csx17 [Planctomycetota bacterium]